MKSDPPSFRPQPRGALSAGGAAARGLAAAALAAGAAFGGVVAASWADLPAPPEPSRQEAPGLALRDAGGQDFAWLPTRPEPGGPIALEDASPALGRMLEALESLLWSADALGPFEAETAAALERVFLPARDDPAPGRQDALRRKAHALAARWAYGPGEARRILLNNAPFGGSAVGFEAAARVWFGHGASRLSLSEAAMLAGALAAPAKSDPFADMAAARARAESALGLLRARGLLTEEAFAEARARPAAPRLETRHEMDFTLWTLERLPAETRAPATRVTVRTTLDLGLQRALERVTAAVLSRAAGADPRLQVGAVVMSHDGAVRAMEGARPDRAARGSATNRAAGLPRPMGAAIAPLLAAEALREGAALLEAGAFFDIGSAEAVRAAGRLNHPLLKELFEGLGLETPPQGPAAAHSARGTPLALASAWAGLLNDGRPSPPCAYVEIIAPPDRPRVVERMLEREPLLGEGAARRALELTIRRAALSPLAQRAALPDREAAMIGADAGADFWFVGATADYVAAVWIGRDDGARPGGVGPELAADLWKAIMTEAYAAHPLPARPLLEPPPPAQRMSALPGDGGGKSVEWPGYRFSP